MAIDPKHLIQLTEILDCQSFTVAAERLNTSQPALSRMASALEAQLGAPIFTSRRNPVTPTTLGTELASYGRSIRAATEQTSKLAERVAAGQQGELRIGAPPFHSQRVASGFIASWLQRHPEIRIVLQNGYAPTLLSQLVEGHLDLIMAPVDVIEGIPNLIVERLTRGENVIVCRAEHPLLAEPKITPEMLSQARWITHARDSLLNRDTRLALTAVGVDYIDLPAFESNSAGAMNAVMENSDMLTVLPDLIAGDMVEMGGYAVLPFRLPGPYRPFGYITHEARQNPALLAFREGLSIDIAKAYDRARDICERALTRAG
ncbi:MAG: LysR family transcriptional regulator [Rhodospirillaceae bacterium]|jgi:DNA-binding transcriptional LysR family regulator|nr:LysR family transcriptional regulator [Rhodospirillaceae bacterium]MBT5943536.1 LysR family transcriptional regulator [Rhodospirillaceae bacterium]MBT6403997.1 LysR family transcriptional regulator [Rhodospirillaceae bacterium]MBT6536627.1 LysR family transcriptional regulator [Rhodospirillaceae bacterium]MBT7361048.1 LysR family transcriptional regulator [Rhodospirillaceae bacterium]